MLLVEMNVNRNHDVASIKIVRGEPHKKLKHHFWYSYQADDDKNHRYIGEVLHNYNHGAFQLVQKVTKDVYRHQKLRKEAGLDV